MKFKSKRGDEYCSRCGNHRNNHDSGHCTQDRGDGVAERIPDAKSYPATPPGPEPKSEAEMLRSIGVTQARTYDRETAELRAEVERLKRELAGKTGSREYIPAPPPLPEGVPWPRPTEHGTFVRVIRFDSGVNDDMEHLDGGALMGRTRPPPNPKATFLTDQGFAYDGTLLHDFWRWDHVKVPAPVFVPMVCCDAVLALAPSLYASDLVVCECLLAPGHDGPHRGAMPKGKKLKSLEYYFRGANVLIDQSKDVLWKERRVVWLEDRKR